jgi:two-component system cell cycle sensor histidine kinase/response regulator CckA
VYTHGGGGVPVLRAEAGSARRPQADVKGDVSVCFGPAGRPDGNLVIDGAAAHQLAPLERELIAGAGHLLGLVAQRERLELRVRKAQKLEIFAHMAGGVAHDFNNVLAVVGTSATTIGTFAPRGTELEAELSLIERAVERGRLLSGRLLGAHWGPGSPAGVIDVNETVFAARGLLEGMLQGRVGIITELEPRSLLIHANREEIEQVLINLVLNARDATPSEGDVLVRTGHTPGFVSFSVSDRGSGMAQQTRQRMFEPFFTTKAGGEGAGLGLSTVQEIVLRGDGRLEVQTAVGQGTTITVQWPCAASNCCPLAVSGAA